MPLNYSVPGQVSINMSHYVKKMVKEFPDASAGEQVVFIPAIRADNHLVPTIIEEHKHYFNPHIISLMLMWDPEKCTTLDVCQSVQPTTCDVN